MQILGDLNIFINFMNYLKLCKTEPEELIKLMYLPLYSDCSLCSAHSLNTGYHTRSLLLQQLFYSPTLDNPKTKVTERNTERGFLWVNSIFTLCTFYKGQLHSLIRRSDAFILSVVFTTAYLCL